MNIEVVSDYETLCKMLAEEMANVVRNKPEALLCLAAGHTSLGVFAEMIAMAQAGKISFGRCTFIGLDEWAGKGSGDDGSCIDFMRAHLFDPLGIRAEQIVFYDGKGNLAAECSRVDRFLREHGPIDYILLGMGMNAHLGLNEPGTPFERYSHVTVLDETTKTVGQKYFKEDTGLSGGITMGMLHFKEARRVVLMVNGKKKADIVRKLIVSPTDEALPASYLKRLGNASLFLDGEAASKLNFFSEETNTSSSS